VCSTEFTDISIPDVAVRNSQIDAGPPHPIIWWTLEGRRYIHNSNDSAFKAEPAKMPEHGHFTEFVMMLARFVAVSVSRFEIRFPDEYNCSLMY
jgi:hypothetical protein